MPFVALALAVLILALPVAAPPAFAHHGKASEHQEMAAVKKSKKAKKPAKSKPQKEEYMRAAPYR